MRIHLRPCLPLLVLASGCANSSEYNRPAGDVGDGSGASVFDPTRVAQIELSISDADLASAKQLERIRLELEGPKAGIDTVRMVLVGSPVLTRILELPSARALATRVGMRAML